MKNIKTVIFLAITILLGMCAGCENPDKNINKTTERVEGYEKRVDNEMEYIEGYEGLSDEEANQKMIEEADMLEVVPDKK